MGSRVILSRLLVGFVILMLILSLVIGSFPAVGQ